MTEPINYVIPPDAIVNLSFQRNKVNYTLHINNYAGLITLTEENKDKPLFIELLT